MKFKPKSIPLKTTAIILALVLIFIFKHLLPSNIGKIAFIIPVVLIDLYLWASIKSEIKGIKKSIQYLIFGFYWLPFSMFAGSYVLAAFVPFKDWNHVFRTYFFAVIIIAYASKLLPALFFGVSDLVRSIVYLIAKLSPSSSSNTKTGLMPRSKFLKNLGLLGGGVVFSGLLTGMIRWVYDFKVRHQIVPLLNLPEAFKGFKIVQISDLHLGSWSSTEPLEDAVRMINDLKPNLVVFTGDLVNYATNEALPFAQTLAKIKAEFGVYTVLGNHDYGDYIKWDRPTDKARNMLDLYRFYKSIGWKLLNNTGTYIEKEGQKIALLGVENWGAIMRFPKKGDIEKAKLGFMDAPIKILLSHDPTHWDHIISKSHPDISLTLAGHTHGAQFGFERGSFKWSPAQYIYRQWAGLYQSADKTQYLYVNRGIGHIGYPGRIGILPEITLLELV
jgi:predicted MPP superfamily phosphohydrolase